MTNLPPLRLDPTTLLFSISMLGFMTALLSIGSAMVIGPASRGLGHWGKAMSCLGAGFLLFFFRGHAPELLTVAVANLLVLASAGYVLLAHLQFLGTRCSEMALGALCVVGLAGALAPQVFGLPAGIGVIAVSLVFSTLLAMSAAAVLGDSRWRRVPVAWIASAGIGVMALSAAVRAILAMTGGIAAAGFEAATVPPVVVLLTGGAACIAASLGFVLMVHERQRQEVLESARRDGLTGLLTRTALFDSAERSNTRVAGPQAVVMADVDHFKAINDVYGHAAGDIVLAHAGRLVRAAIRSADLAGRYGGEEFCVVLADCGEAQARRFAERLVHAAMKQRVRLPGGAEVRFTFSVGYTVRNAPAPGAEAESFSTALERADAALYEAKRAGRNRAAMAGTGERRDAFPDPAASEVRAPPNPPLAVQALEIRSFEIRPLETRASGTRLSESEGRGAEEPAVQPPEAQSATGASDVAGMPGVPGVR